MIVIFDTIEKYNAYAAIGLKSGKVYYVREDGSIHFCTNNIDGVFRVYDSGNGGEFIKALCEDTIQNLIIPQGTSYIKNNCFANWSHITSVEIPDSVTSIGEDAFYECTSLSSVTIPNTVTNIGRWTFGYTSLTSITLPNSITTISDSLFSRCYNLQNVTIPNNVALIDTYAFQKCSGLTSVIIGDGIKKINYCAFIDCTSLSSITILAKTPPTLPYADAFQNNASDRKFYVPAESVEAYKTATTWSTFKNNLLAIPQ